MLNNVTLQGRLVNDIELRRTESGVSVCSFTVACERDYREPDGTRGTDFIDIVAWRGKAEFMAKYFSKGDAIILFGRLVTRTREDKDGNKRRQMEIELRDAYFGGKKKEPEAAPAWSPADSEEPLPF